MEQDEIYLLDIARIFLREWKWFAAVLILVTALATAFAFVTKAQWQATARIQIGHVGEVPAGESTKVATLSRVIERLTMVPFQNQVLTSLGIETDSSAGKLYRESMDLVPLPYAGPLLRMTIRGFSREQARQLAQTTAEHLRAIHDHAEAGPLQLANARLKAVEANLADALAERKRITELFRPGTGTPAAASDNPMLSMVLLTNKNDDIRRLERVKRDLEARLSSSYTFRTSLLGSIYVPEKKVAPHRSVIVGIGLMLGAVLGALAAMARNFMRRRGRRQGA